MAMTTVASVNLTANLEVIKREYRSGWTGQVDKEHDSITFYCNFILSFLLWVIGCPLLFSRGGFRSPLVNI